MNEKYKQPITFSVSGKYALFTDPISKLSEEKLTYPVPTYSALKGIVEKIYWKPTLNYVIDAVRIMNPIKMESKGVNPLTTKKHHSPSNYTYLRDVHYQVQMHIEFNMNREDLKQDRDIRKHYNIFMRSLEKGGRLPIYLGVSECFGYVEPCEFGEGKSYYDDVEFTYLPFMLHGIDYPNTKETEIVRNRFWYPKMNYGVINFIRPEECEYGQEINHYPYKDFQLGENLQSVEDLEKSL